MTDHGHFRVLNGSEVVGDMPVEVLVDACPIYTLDVGERPPSRDGRVKRNDRLGAGDAADVLLALLGRPEYLLSLPMFEQYDWIVQSRTVRRPDEADAAVLQLPDGSGIAVSIDGNGRRTACDPRAGAAEAVYECAANLACVGAEPLGLTNCLNFGNPEKPEGAWQLSEAVEGIAEASEALGVPVVGGNVSLYNESPSGSIYPTPVIGMVGKLPDASKAGRLGFVREGDLIAIVGEFEPSLNGSELAKLKGLEPEGPLPPTDANAVRDAQETVRRGIRSGALHNAHDIAEGGLAVALAEACLAGGIGARVELPEDFELFGEAPGRAFVVSGTAEAVEGHRLIGRVGGSELEIAGILKVPLSGLRQARDGGLRYA